MSQPPEPQKYALDSLHRAACESISKSSRPLPSTLTALAKPSPKSSFAQSAASAARFAAMYASTEAIVSACAGPTASTANTNQAAMRGNVMTPAPGRS
ncbi:MAG: hypothetical protein AB7S80_16595, partial [Rhizobiaceae bacterium]